MKYNENQKILIIKNGLSAQKETVKKRNKLKENFPVTVEIQGGYYIVESKINNHDN